MNIHLNKMFSVITILALMLMALPMQSVQAAGPVSLTTLDTPYTQNFDTLPTTGSATWANNSTIPGWFHARTGTGTTIVANNGSSNAGNLYSYGTGTATDRALGSLGSGNAAVGNLFWGVRLSNDTGATITSLDISYIGEQWRNSAAAAQTVAFSYLVGSPTVTGSLAEFQSAGVAVSSLDFTSPITGGTAGALDGNLAANRVAITFSITGLSIPNGTEVMLRWSDPDHTGNDHGLSIDDFSVTPHGAVIPPDLTIDDVSASEGNSGSTTFTFNVTLSTPAGVGGVTFDIATADDSAMVADNDYVLNALTAQTISAGNSSYTFDVTVNGDTNVEPDENFFVNVSGVTGATVSDDQGMGTIQNDDAVVPDLTVNDVSASEGNSGTTTFSFTVGLSVPAGAGGVTFDIATADGTAQDDNPATEDNDYVAQSLMGQTIPATSSTYTFDVVVNGDTTVEPNETFFVDVSNVTGATVSDGQGQGTIQNDDVPPPGSVVISQIYGGGGNAGAAYKNDFIEIYNRSASTISLTGWSVQYAAATGTGSWAVTALSGSIAPGEHYLVQEGAGAGGTLNLPTPDATGTIAMGSTAGKVALVNVSTPLGGACPASSSISDLVGYGTTANCFEGSGRAPAPSNTTAVLRLNNGATDTDNNAADFVVGAPNPRSRTPSVTSTSPSNGAFGILLDRNITINFSKPVNVTASWFTISCANSGNHSAAVSGGPTSFTLDPDADFMYNELCTVTIFADEVTDQDANDPPDNLVADYVFSFTSIELLVCGDPTTPIHNIQGSGTASPLAGMIDVVIEGVVVGDYQNTTTEFSGFHLQEEDLQADGNPATSEGIFVFDNGFGVDVLPGDVVRVKGTVAEFFDLTEMTTIKVVQVCGNGNSVTAATVDLPVAALSAWEALESMLINIPEVLTVTETFTLARFGEVSLSANGRLFTPTNIVEPGAPAIAQQDLNDRSRIVLDDANNEQNIDPTRYPTGGLSAENTLRSGYTVNGLTGILEERFSVYRVQPVGEISFNADNLRPDEPEDVGGTLTVVGMNLLNFFNTFSACTGGAGGDPIDCRGANSQDEFDRQYPKTLAAILAMDPDILGVNEMENDGYGPTSAIQFLVDQLNLATAPGTYAFIDVDTETGQTNAMGTDAIKVGILYKPSVVTPVGQTAALNTVAFVNGGDNGPRSRPSLAQAFQQNSNGEVFIVDVNHLKSKGSACNAPDAGDGQGNCNQVRVNAATELVNWLATDPTGTGDPDVLLIGDYNAYAKEDPIDVIKAAGYTDLIDTLVGTGAYSYVFDGQSGYLDHALSSPSLTPQVNDVTEWHINADEPVALDYNLEFKSENHQTTLYDDDQFRVSDHDPVIVGLNLDTVAPTVTIDQASGQADPTGFSPIHFTVVFSEDVTGFDDSDVVLGGTAGATTAVVTGGPATYDVAVSGMTANGTVTASIPAGAASDAAGNASTASTSTDNIVTFANAAPTIVVAAGGMCASSGGTMNLTVADAEGDALTLSGNSSNTSAVPNANIVFGGSGSNRTVTITAIPAATVRTAIVTITVNDGISTSPVTITVVVGTSGNNTALNGTSGADLILGLGGNDTLSGLAGIDLLCGGSGNDTINAGDNDDTLDGETGNDVLNGNNGNDILRGDTGNDTLNGGAGNDNMSGGSGNDSLTGGANADFFSGGTGNDTNTDFNAGQGDTTDGT